MLPTKHRQTDRADLPEGMASSDPELLERCRQGDEGAWEQVVKKYQRLIYSIPLNFGLGPDDAADIFQQSFLSLIEYLDRLRPDSNLGAWLATVARRHALHRLRKRKREQVGAEGDIAESEEVQESVVMDASIHFDQVQEIDHALNQLDPRCRDLLLVLYFDSRQPSYEEVARRAGLAVGSVGPTRARCLERLRQILPQD